MDWFVYEFKVGGSHQSQSIVDDYETKGHGEWRNLSQIDFIEIAEHSSDKERVKKRTLVLKREHGF